MVTSSCFFPSFLFILLIYYILLFSFCTLKGADQSDEAQQSDQARQSTVVGQSNEGTVTVTVTASSTSMEGPKSLRMGGASEIDAAVLGGFALPIYAGQTVNNKVRGAFATQDI